MKIAIIGSTQYQEKFNIHKAKLESEGHIIKIPAFDNHSDFDEIQVCYHNKHIIKWADEVHVIWDGRSIGTIFDFGMIFALGKPIQIIYLESKTFPELMRKYARL